MDIDEFKDGLKSRRYNRRQLLQGLASFGIVPMLMPLAPRDGRAASDEQPTMFTWSGYDDANFMQAYVAKYGETPRFSLFGDEEEAFQKMRAGFQPDLMYPCFSKVRIWHDAGLLAPIETERLSNWPDVLDALKVLPGSEIDGRRFFVPSDFGSTSVIFRADLCPEYVDDQTWGILWDEKYAGRLSSFDSITDTVVIAGIYAGVNNPFDLGPEDMEIVRAKLAELVPLQRLMANDVTTMSQALASGEVVASMAWNAHLWQLQEFADQMPEGAEFVWMTPKEGATTWVCGLTIHPVAVERGLYEKCHEVIDAMISPESGHFELLNWYYGVANRKAYEMEGVDAAFLDSIGLTSDVNGFLASGTFSSRWRTRIRSRPCTRKSKPSLGSYDGDDRHRKPA